MKHKKPKQTSKKKQKTKKSSAAAAPTKTPSIDEFIEAGDAAAASEESDKALAFFASAENLLRKEQDAAGKPIKTDKLVYVLEKMGEAKASLGELEAAKQDFENAIAVLTSSSSSLDGKMNEKSAPYQETLADLYLYIGQLSSDHLALEAYKKGLVALESSVELWTSESLSKEQLENTENSMEIDSNTNETQRMLNEAR